MAAYLAYSAMVGGDSLVAGLLPPPDGSAVTPLLSAHHMVAMPKLTEYERQWPLGSTFGYLTPNTGAPVFHQPLTDPLTPRPPHPPHHQDNNNPALPRHMRVKAAS